VKIGEIMVQELSIHFVESPGNDEWGAIGGGINSYNQENAGAENAQRVCYVLQNEEKEIVGGIIGLIYWDWFCIDLMWIKEEYRNQEYGHKLITMAEEEARKRGARHAHLDTFTFQAPGFYEKHGYKVFGKLADFPKGHARYYMSKEF
jgi:ribosomal protein S18 acetylase RimI-like enzyme